VIAKNQKGFTLVEIIITIAISSFVSVVFIMTVVPLFNSVYRTIETVNLKIKANVAFDAVEELVAYSTSLSANAPAWATDPGSPSGGWSINTTPKTLIIVDAATTKNHKVADRLPIYYNGPDCVTPSTLAYSTRILYSTTPSAPYTYKLRTISPGVASLCGTPYDSNCAVTTGNCVTENDWIKDITNITIDYFGTNNVPIDPITGNVRTAESVVISLTIRDKVLGGNRDYTLTRTMKKLSTGSHL
jgi:prepilin-type N-terminal cleavage/methylation domain-containing protein